MSRLKEVSDIVGSQKDLHSRPDEPHLRTAALIMREETGFDPDEAMRELEGLAEAAGYRVLAEVRQRRGIDRRFQVGRGKIAEAISYRPDVLIFYKPLSPTQYFNIRKEFAVRVIDRFNLILEIFASRAATREAKLQVELARLTYEAPFVRSVISLRKLRERPGFGGGGAYEESAYQDIRGRISRIRSALADVERTGEERRTRRRELGFDLVALAGYTNAGKSTLMNVLTGAGVPAKDEMFTTLVPITRLLALGSRRVLLTDTVGFIDDLPHFMIKAFRSTLSEVSCADLVLLVADLSDSALEIRRKLAACHRTLWEMNISSPVITVLNKADRLDASEIGQRLEMIGDLAPEPLIVSASGGSGLEPLLDRTARLLRPSAEVSLSLPNTPEGHRELSRLCEKAELLEVAYGDRIDLLLRGREDIISRAGARWSEDE